jgi:hypothetical protein
MSRLSNRFSTLSPAQNAVINPVTFGSKRAKVLSLANTGLYTNGSGVLTCSAVLEPDENLGHPVRVVGLASMAEPVHALKVGDYVSFEGTIQGSLRFGRSPYVVLSKLQQLER